VRFGFAHLEDPEQALQLAAWSLSGMDPFGMPAASVNIDKHVAPYEGSHELKTDATPSSGSYADAHRSIAVDADTPIAAGAPLFAEAWSYLVGP
jgi:hypothetical protein